MLLVVEISRAASAVQDEIQHMVESGPHYHADYRPTWRILCTVRMEPHLDPRANWSSDHIRHDCPDFSDWIHCGEIYGVSREAETLGGSYEKQFAH